MSLFSRSFLKDVLTTYSAEVTALVAAIAIPGLVSRLVGMEQLGIYLLVRRIVAAAVHPVTLGFAVALARFLPQDGQQLGVRVRWSLSAILVAALFASGLLFVAIKWRFVLARTLLGQEELATFIKPLAVLLLANVLHVVEYGHYRGMMQMRLANAMQVLNSGLVPVLTLSRLRTGGVWQTLYLTGVLMLLVDCFFVLPLFRVFAQTFRETRPGWFLHAMRNLFGYGIGRVPTSALTGVLFSIAPIQLAHKVSLALVGLFMMGLNFLRLGEAAIGPLGILILPRVAAVRSRKSLPQMMNDVQLLLGSTITIGLFGCSHAAVLSDLVLRLWLGDSTSHRWELFVPLIAALPFYMAHELLRHTIDAASAIPYNSMALALSVGLLLSGVFSSNIKRIVLSQVVAFMVLGVVTTILWLRIYRIRFTCLRQFLNPLIFSALSVGWTLVIRSQFPNSIFTLATNELLLFAILLFWLWACCKQGRQVLTLQASQSTEGVVPGLENIS